MIPGGDRVNLVHYCSSRQVWGTLAPCGRSALAGTEYQQTKDVLMLGIRVYKTKTSSA